MVFSLPCSKIMLVAITFLFYITFGITINYNSKPNKTYYERDMSQIFLQNGCCQFPIYTKWKWSHESPCYILLTTRVDQLNIMCKISPTYGVIKMILNSESHKNMFF